MSLKEIRELEITTLSDLQIVISQIQNSQRTSKRMMHLKRLQPFLQAMEQYGNLINIFVNACSMTAYIWVGSPRRTSILSLIIETRAQ
jgi:hypothetical protein